jgi:hypothetical protein
MISLPSSGMSFGASYGRRVAWFGLRGSSVSVIEPRKVPFCLQPARILININIAARVCAFYVQGRVMPISALFAIFCYLILFKYFCIAKYLMWAGVA